MTAPVRAATLVQTMSAAMHRRLRNAGWRYDRDAQLGRERWIEQTLTDGRLDLREVRVDELPGVPGGRVVEGFNGHERILVRCVEDTEPALVLRTLDDWHVVPSEGVTR